MKVIIITGSVGTGKTTLSKLLARKLNFHYIDVNKIIRKYNISEGYDKKRKTNIVDINKLNKALIKEIKNYKNTIKKNSIISSNKNISIKNKRTFEKINEKNKNNKKIKNGIIIDSHLSHYLPKKYVDLCIVTKCNLKVLKNRLKKKKYSKDKIRENLDTEIFDVCLNEAKENRHKIIVMDTTKGIKTHLESFTKLIK
jgi:adenylate kinase|tara:strand:- start:3403 stop:3996 length:594 start_codon:yes stop_codon:yes gene_type:complete